MAGTEAKPNAKAAEGAYAAYLRGKAALHDFQPTPREEI